MPSTVLIVDDSESCRAMLEMALHGLPGVDLKTAADGREALAAIAQSGESLRALVTDLQLPRMDGFELIETVRAQPFRSALPIVVISGDSDPRIPTRVAKLGANAFFPKPYSPAEVRHKLEQLLG